MNSEIYINVKIEDLKCGWLQVVIKSDLFPIRKRCHYLEIPGQHGASADGQKFEDDRRPGEDLVSEPEDKMEVSLDDEFKCEMYLSEGTMNLRSEVHLYLRTRRRNLN